MVSREVQNGRSQTRFYAFVKRNHLAKKKPLFFRFLKFSFYYKAIRTNKVDNDQIIDNKQ